MTDRPAPDQLPSAEPASNNVRSFLRRWLVPVVAIASIIAVIWWIEQSSGSGTSSRGERYGPSALPAALAAKGLDISAEQGALAPDFLLEGLEGGELRLSDFRGQPVVLNFWATWCAPCRKEIPQFVEAYQMHKAEGLVVIAVNLQEGKSIVGGYAEDFGMDFPIAIDRDGEVGDDYRLIGLPSTFFIDRDGVISRVFSGPFQEDAGDTEVRGAIAASDLEAGIAEILASPPPEGTSDE